MEALNAAEGCVHLYVFRAAVCSQCRYIKPAALQIAEEYAGRAQVSLIMLDSPEGQRLVVRYALRCVPAALTVNADGQPLGSVRCGFATYPTLRTAVEEALQEANCR